MNAEYAIFSTKGVLANIQVHWGDRGAGMETFVTVALVSSDRLYLTAVTPNGEG